MPEGTTARFDSAALTAWMARTLAAMDMPPEDARTIGEGLTSISLRGVDTHGIAQFPVYVKLIREGAMNVRPKMTITGEGALLAMEADLANGYVSMKQAMAAVIDRARTLGVAAISVGRSGHLGALGHFAGMAAEAGMIGLIAQNGPPLMGPPGAKRRAIGNNPLAFGMPVPDGPPLIFDIAASEAAYGKIGQTPEGGEIPEGWALDKTGAPTTSREAALAGILLSMAGTKGIGLAMMVEALAGGLSSTKVSGFSGPFGGFALVIDPAAAGGREAFAANAAEWIAIYHASQDGARYPGERAAQVAAERLAAGVPVPETLRATFAEIGETVGAPFPAPISGG